MKKTIRDFDLNKDNSFKTFANLCIERQIITAIKSSNRQKHIPLNSYISLNNPNYEKICRFHILVYVPEGEEYRYTYTLFDGDIPIDSFKDPRKISNDQIYYVFVRRKSIYPKRYKNC